MSLLDYSPSDFEKPSFIRLLWVTTYENATHSHVKRQIAIYILLFAQSMV